MSSASPPTEPGRRPSGLRWNSWNLLLLLPLLMLVTPWFNIDHPRLGGIPFFYWYQLVFVLVGVGSVWIVHTMTRNTSGGDTSKADRLSVDQLDEGEAK
ncbi:MAG TPA: DUF3311 domain-containing protein [Pseudonocardiaceae bacterium]|jgi:hypothetical protein|nr:DUF3311 domain-containing protein [Pseudonocardiaceae bacterium]